MLIVSDIETKKLGEDLAKKVLQLPKNKQAVVLSLQGDLGAGKTTFLQGFAKGLGVKEKILSPTFVIQKRFSLNGKFKNFYHIDSYRLNEAKEILELDFKNIISDPENILAIEWPEKIEEYLPKKVIEINFKFVEENKREINITL